MKKNGFTLVELLAVIIIITLLVLIVLPSIFNSIKNSSDNSDNTVKEMIYRASEMYIENHDSEFPKVNGNQFVIELKDLVDETLLTSPIKLSNSDNIEDDMCVQVTYNEGFNYDLKESGTCNEKIKICEAVFSETSEEYNPGDKYLCDVNYNKKYTFFVISTNKDEDQNIESINLILDGFIAMDGSVIKTNADIENLKKQNIQYETAWITTDEYSDLNCLDMFKESGIIDTSQIPEYCSTNFAKTDKGPISAIAYLQEATSSWKYVPNIEINYTDEGDNYGEIKTEGNKTSLKDKSGKIWKTFYNLKARLPKYSEINIQFESNNYELSDLKENEDENFITQLPPWISQYIPRYGTSYTSHDSCIKSNDGTVCSLSGFWLLSSVNESTQRLAYDVSTDRFLGKTTTIAQIGYYSKIFTGVRPVITIPITLLS